MASIISYLYEIRDRYSAKLKKISRATDAFEKRIGSTRKSLAAFGTRMTSMQGAIAGVVGVMGAAGIGRTVLNFEQSMNKLGAVSLATDSQMRAFRDTAKHLGKTTQFSASQVASGMVYLKMAGLSTDQVLKAIPGTLELAAAGGLDLAQAADIATNVLAQMGFEVSELSHVNDVLAYAQANANTNITALFEAMKPVAVTAKNLGISLEDLTAQLGAMANAGEKGSIAGTLLRNAWTELAGATASQKKLYKALGIDLKNYITSAGKLKNLKDLIGKLKALDAQGRLTVPVLQKLFGDRGFRAVQTLIGQGAKKIGSFSKALHGAHGVAHKMSLIMMRGLPGVVKAIASAWEALQIALFESGLADMVIKLGNKFTDVLRNLTATNPQLLKFVGVLGGIMVAALPAMMAIGMLASAVAGILSPVGLALAGITGFIATIATLYSKNAKIKESVDNLFKSFGDLGKTLSDSGKAFSQWADDVSGGPGALIDAMASGLDTISKLVKGLEFDLRLMVFLLYKAGLLQQKIVKAAPNVKTFAIGAEGAATEIKKQAYVAPIMGQSASGQLLKRQTEAIRMQGQIHVSAEPGLRVNNASMSTDLPGNLGFNLR